MKLNQKGVTLIELIAALALVSLIAAGALTALSIGVKHSTVETTKTTMQQDGNLIVSTLLAAHRQTGKYNIKIENGYLMLQECETNDPATCGLYKQVNDREYNYTDTMVKTKDVEYTVPNPGTTLPEISIEPKSFHSDIRLKLKSGKNSITINTSLTRIINK